MCVKPFGPFDAFGKATIANYDLSVEDPSWHCDTLGNVEAAAKTTYYVARLLRHLERQP